MTIEGTGTATITITDYYYCIPTTVNVTVKLGIATAEELVAFSERVRAGETALDAGLANDIDLTDTVWYSTTGMINNQIGTLEQPYAGTFDGNGYTISGLDIYAKNDTKVDGIELYKSEYVTGFFGATNGATIKNLTVAGKAEYIGQAEVVNDVSTGRHGGVVGKAVNTTLTNVASEVEHGGYGYWYFAKSNYGPHNIGGIVGWGQNVDMDMCANYGDILIYNTKYVAGIIGYVASAETSSTFNRCVNHGNVMASEYYGGVIGFVEGTSGSEPDTITNCYAPCNVGGRSWHRPDKDVPNGSYSNSLSGGVLMCGFTEGANVKAIDCFAVGQCYDDGTVYDAEGKLPVCVSAIYMKGYNDGKTDQFEDVGYYSGGNVNTSYSNPQIDPGIFRSSLWEWFSSAAFLERIGDQFFVPKGAEYPALKWECAHSELEVSSNGNGVHTVSGTCTACGQTVDPYIEVCVDANEDFLCDVCSGFVGADRAYQIEDADDLLAFSALVAIGGANLDAELTADIELVDTVWYNKTTGVCNTIGTVEIPYSGNFNGNGHEISGLSIDVRNTSYPTAEYAVGLFGATDGATVTNLTVAGSAYHMGQGSVAGSTDGAMLGFHGSLIGKAVDTVVTGCTSEVEHTGYGYWSYGYYGPTNIGGLVGYAKGLTMDKCVNAGMINIHNSVNVGGLVGYVEASKAPTTITRSQNKANILGTVKVGGLVGFIVGTTGKTADTITNCYNTGAIASESLDRHVNSGNVWTYTSARNGGTLLGGFTGNSNVQIENCYTTAQCFDDGTVNTDADKYPFTVDAIYYNGHNDAMAHFTNVYYLKGENTYLGYTCPPNTAIWEKGLLEATSDNMLTEDFAKSLGDAFAYVEGSFPILAWQAETN